MHKTHVELTYRHTVSNYRLCDMKITILHTITFDKTCWKLHQKIGQQPYLNENHKFYIINLHLLSHQVSIEQNQHFMDIIY